MQRQGRAESVQTRKLNLPYFLSGFAIVVMVAAIAFGLGAETSHAQGSATKAHHDLPVVLYADQVEQIQR